MTDLTSQDTDRLANELQRLSGSIGNFTSGISRRDSEDRLRNDLFRKRAEKAGDALSALSGSARNASHYFTRVLGGAAMGAAFGKLISVGNDMTDTYRELVNVGQNFNGSLLEMSIAAAGAGLPLENFSEAVKRSSMVVARMGMRNFVQLQRSVSTSMMQFGMFAMTTGQVTEHLGQYLETSRRMGIVERMTTQQVARSFTGLMETTSALSNITGVAREQIAELANSALQSSMAMSRVAMLTGRQQVQATEQLRTSMSILASQAGEAGQFLAGLHAEAFGTGSAAFTEQGRALISVGLGHLGSMFENAMSPDATISAMEQFRTELTTNVPLLRSLALGTGESAANARQLLAVQSQMREMSMADLREQQRRSRSQDGITRLFNSFSTAWNLIVGSFREGFLKGFRPLFATVGDFTRSEGFRKIQDMAKTLGERLGDFIAWVLNPTTLRKIGELLQGVGTFFMGLIRIGGRVIEVVGGIISAMPWEALGRGLGLVVTVMGTLARWMGNVLSAFSRIPGVVEAAVAALAGFLIFRRLQNAFANRMVVNAATVIVNGGSVGGGGVGGDGFGDGVDDRGGRRRGRRASLRRIARRRGIGTAARVGMRRAGRGLGVIGRGGARAAVGAGARRGLGSVLKKIPGLGWLAGLAMGVGRLFQGDVVGALGEVGSGIAGSFPGLGTAASVGIDGAMMARDAGAFDGGGGGGGGGGAVPAGARGRRGRMARLAMMGALGAGGLGGAYLLSGLLGGGDDAPQQNNEEVVRKLDELIRAVNRNTDMLAQTQQGMAGIQDQQRSLLTSIERQGRANN